MSSLLNIAYNSYSSKHVNESVSTGKIRFVDTIKCACAVERLYIKIV